VVYPEPSPVGFQLGGFAFLRGVVEILKMDKNSTDLLCFMFQFGGIGALFGGQNAPKIPVATGLGLSPEFSSIHVGKQIQGFLQLSSFYLQPRIFEEICPFFDACFVDLVAFSSNCS